MQIGLDSISTKPVFTQNGFKIEADSMHNAEIAIEILDAIIEKKGVLDLQEGARKFARQLSRKCGKNLLDLFLYNANARKGWMVPNQYWTPGVLSPMPILGKYYMHYGQEFYPPRELGNINAKRMIKELIMDNAGFCRFHRQWAEEMIPVIIDNLYNIKNEFLENIKITASRINSRNAAVYWESEKNVDFIYSFLKRKHDIDNDNSKELLMWLDNFKINKHEAALNYWFEIYKGVHESLREF
jgi:glyceraldehyde-3-phosphate dehydrogenase (ferredoxin)